MHSESEGEGKEECEENADVADRGALRLHAPIKTPWNSVFDCINRALKEAITRFSENDMELDGRIDGEDDENTSDGEAGRVVEEMVRTTHPHSLLFLYVYQSINQSIILQLHGVLTTEVMSLANVTNQDNNVQMFDMPKGQSRIRTPHYPTTKNKRNDLGPKGQTPRKPDPPPPPPLQTLHFPGAS